MGARNSGARSDTNPPPRFHYVGVESLDCLRKKLKSQNPRHLVSLARVVGVDASRILAIGPWRQTRFSGEKIRTCDYCTRDGLGFVPA